MERGTPCSKCSSCLNCRRTRSIPNGPDFFGPTYCVFLRPREPRGSADIDSLPDAIRTSAAGGAADRQASGRTPQKTGANAARRVRSQAVP